MTSPTTEDRTALDRAIEAAIDRAADRLIRRLEARYGKAATTTFRTERERR